MLPTPPQGPYGRVNLWDFPDVWRAISYGDIWIRCTGDEWIVQESSGQAVLRRDAGRRGGYVCSCTDMGPCAHVRVLVALNI